MTSQTTRSERLWLVAVIGLAVSVRLIGITQPLVDHWSWRQSVLGMMAENFYTNGFNILYPQVNYGGNTPGYVCSEFPLVPFIASLLYVVVGIHDWVGRAISVAFFAASLPFLYLLVRKASNARSALFSVAVFSMLPLTVFAGRSFMPDMATFSLSIVALYLFDEWIDRPERVGLFATLVIVTLLAVLSKLPSALIAVPFMYLAFSRRGMAVLRLPGIWVLAIGCAAAAAGWYSHAYRLGT